ncbi:hypothetical protein CABS01_03131 [Colletotrichum abscissum]|uniref:Uncharacterized protein n=1 Tax=Colletotrichum abscissum TaxID=1671311 RepID=A0A9P9X7F7_9PEZI|nr:uncharacterized protein CABS01_03131 [Colletotrichum abscissum]KAI3540734.1 hypothetical protein CABS02_10950 [Colletotrichum abscissum]KAK1477829.1 hypothetical protein CABS01_03131 [Colletotrichum abscissum]
MTGDAFWLSSPSSFNVGLDSPQLAAAKVTLAALAPWWEQWQTIVLWSAGLLPIFSSLPARGSKQEQPAMTDVASLANHPPDSRFPPPINAQSMGESELRTRADVPSNSSRFRIILANEQSDECIG